MAVTLNRNYLEGFIDSTDYLRHKEAVKHIHGELNTRTAKGSDYLGWLNLPEDYYKDEFIRIKNAARRIQETSDVLIVIGIGGSYLGTRAVIELLGSRYYNDFASLKVYYIGNSISPVDVTAVLKLCEDKRVSLNVISKSGTTLEPALAFRIFRAMMEETYGKEEARKRIYITTDREKGALKTVANIEGYECFSIPDDIGGRYSVLTAVGLLPIAAAGFDIDALMAGAADSMKNFDDDNLEVNDCYKYAVSRYILSEQGKTVELCSCFEPSFSMFGEWYKQLFGESEGKENKGIFPTSMIYSTDLHSMGQYVQEGKRILFETLVRFHSLPNDIRVQENEDDFDELNYVSNRYMSYINNQASDGVLLAHTEGGVPCMVIEVSDISEYSIGELIYFFEKACAVSGALLGVNPFDQPGVENYKVNMFSLLNKPGYEESGKEIRKRLK